MARAHGGAVLETALPLPLLHRGKVRDVYEAGAGELLMVASDRVSAFDVVMSRPIPRKGEVLTLITAWWLERLGIEHHLIAVDPDAIVRRHPELEESRAAWARRAMLVRRTAPLPVECVVRGYLSGSAWKEYKESGTLAGEPMPRGLSESDRLAQPIFSPATKAEQGMHDENIPFAGVVERLGATLAGQVRDLSHRIYDFGRRTCEEHRIILADTKFEFGQDPQGRLLLIDEVLTPDSSRFWPKERYAPGRGQPSLDKQPIRDWLDALPGWNKTPPAPELPDAVVDAATARYLEIFKRLTGSELDDWRAPALEAADGRSSGAVDGRR
ncbi:MAG: phosphoribosylaminoimidazolesuccinocarboxamide synthase [Gemmatimonadetes bacterium]|nr:phosphoribosylaminoimidazolesuccinocarboxamide synthase [Gemmatimonadota bacterium]